MNLSITIIVETIVLSLNFALLPLMFKCRNILMEFSWHNASKICDMSVPDMLLQDKSRYFSFTN